MIIILEEEAAASGAEADGTDEVNHQCDPVHSSNNTLSKPAYYEPRKSCVRSPSLHDERVILNLHQKEHSLYFRS